MFPLFYIKNPALLFCSFCGRERRERGKGEKEGKGQSNKVQLLQNFSREVVLGMLYSIIHAAHLCNGLEEMQSFLSF